MRRGVFLVTLFGIIAIASAVTPVWTPTTLSNDITGDGTTPMVMTASSYTSQTVLLLSTSGHPLYTFNAKSFYTNGFSSATTWGVFIAGTWYPLIGPVDPYDGAGGDGRKDMHYQIFVQVVSATALSGVINLNIGCNVMMSDNSVKSFFNGQTQPLSITVAAATGTFTVAPGIISDDGTVITTQSAWMV